MGSAVVEFTGKLHCFVTYLLTLCCSRSSPHMTAFLPLQLQRDDLAALGNLLLLLACVGRGAPPSLEYLTAHFSREFCHVVAGLLASSEGGCVGAQIQGLGGGWMGVGAFTPL
jgi:hypothetical protein